MSLGEFVSPTEDEWLDALGVDREPAGDEESPYQVEVSVGAGQELHIVVDTSGNSVRLIWTREGRNIVDIFRESARRMSVRSGKGEAHLEIEFETDGLVGRCDIQILPEVVIRDSLLFA